MKRLRQKHIENNKNDAIDERYVTAKLLYENCVRAQRNRKHLKMMASTLSGERTQLSGAQNKNKSWNPDT